MQIDNSMNLITKITNQISKSSLLHQLQQCKQHYNFKKEYLCLEKSCQSYQTVQLFCSECIKEHYQSKHKNIGSSQQNNINIFLGKIKTKAALTINQFRSIYIQKIQNTSNHCSIKINSSNNNQSKGIITKDLGEINMILYNLINEIVQNFKKGYQQKHSRSQCGLKLLYENNQKFFQQMAQDGRLQTLDAKIKFSQTLQSSVQEFNEKINLYCKQIQNQNGSQLSKELYERISIALKDLLIIQEQKKQSIQKSYSQSKPPQQYASSKINKDYHSPPSKIDSLIQKSRNNFKFGQVINLKLLGSPSQNLNNDNKSFEKQGQLENLKNIIKQKIQSIAQKDKQISELSKALNKEKVVSKNLSSRLKDFKKLDERFMKVENFSIQFQKEQQQLKSKSEKLINSPKKGSKNANEEQDAQKKKIINQIVNNVMVQKNSFIRKAKQASKNSSNSSIRSSQCSERRGFGSKQIIQELSFNSIYEFSENRKPSARLNLRKSQK